MPELDGEIRVSSLQTGHARAASTASTLAAVVRERQPPARLYTPQYGRIELRFAPRTTPTRWSRSG